MGAGFASPTAKAMGHPTRTCRVGMAHQSAMLRLPALYLEGLFDGDGDILSVGCRARAVLGDDGVTEVAHYVRSLHDPESEAHDVEKGRTSYNQFCIACHGPGGEGNVALGAPTLLDDEWLYGSSTADVEQTIAYGRYGQMPAFGNRLDDTQIRMLLAWLTRKQ